MEHHLYFQVWANTCICFVFFSFGGVFVFVRFVLVFFLTYDLWGKRSYKIDLRVPVYSSSSSGPL